ncbi:MAG: DUF1850 domain-containing protein [Glaciimonas sp.]|nr:DUF1850 domain-containing protein [Glaciimonas sp.]
MIGVCLAAAGLVVSLPLQEFTLAWTHSIEKILWEEDYRVVPTADGARLQLTEARIRGSGAGMEPPPDAVLADGVWHYRPPLAPLDRLNLARSDYVADYNICWDGSCRGLAELVGSPAAAPDVQIFACGPR